jgi:hypothetical protein
VHAALTLAALGVLAWSFALGAQAPTPAPRMLRITPTPIATLVDSLRGREFIDVRVTAKRGQVLFADLRSTRDANYFNVIEPDSGDVAVFVGSSAGSRFTGIARASGDYTVRVYLMRSAARRNERARFTLAIGVLDTPDASGRAWDARVPGSSFHATSEVPCGPTAARTASTRCALGVYRGASGTAQIHLWSPSGVRRVLSCVRSTCISADPRRPVTTTRAGDEQLVTFGANERYRIPDSVICGG